MAGERETQNRDLTLSPDSYMYLQNVGKGGVITTFKGPMVVNQTGQDQPVRYNPTTRAYQQVALEQAVMQCPRANEGDYVVLENPSIQDNFPTSTQSQYMELRKGRKIVVPGPFCEALWPGQSATVIPGHRLRSNQYLIAMVYNSDAAEHNWDKTVAVSQEDNPNPGANTGEGAEAAAAAAKAKRGLPRPTSFATGTRIVIQGSDVSFFIPCTGVEVLQDKGGEYVREAVTLEQLEYCRLIDENGKNEYPRGPAVVFPKPTQVFAEDKQSRRKFRPIELNNINGIHLKVTANYKGPDIENDISKEREFKEGEELFVTGKTISIYYPKEELSVITYGQGMSKHFSTAIPKGEGRYVINRLTGEITMIGGPNMFLADPRNQIPVRRLLSDDECSLWYPGNIEAINYNRELAAAMAASPSGRSGVVSEGDWRKSQAKRGFAANYLAASGGVGLEAADFAVGASEFSPEETGEDVGPKTQNSGNRVGARPARMETINTKYDGVPKIEVWPGYAVLVTGAGGTRFVVEGPQTILLQYDEKLGHMSLSTGKPKTSDKLVKTAYLCIRNNQVSDIIPFESSDHVKGTVKLSLRVDFEAKDDADKLKWFEHDNYVKYLTDHCRSLVAGMAKKHSIAQIKQQYIDLVRDAILGVKGTEGKRTGHSFANGMKITDTEVLEITLSDKSIAALLDQTQQKVVQSTIEVESARRDLETIKAKEEVIRAQEMIKAETADLKNKMAQRTLASQMELMEVQLASSLSQIDNQRQATELQSRIDDFVAKAKLARDAEAFNAHIQQLTEEQALTKDKIAAETKAAVERFTAAKEGLYEVLLSMQREDIAVKMAAATNIERYLTGDEIGNSLTHILSVIPSLKQFMDNGKDGPNRLTGKAQQPAAR